MVGDGRSGFPGANKSLMLRPASSVIGLEKCVGAGHGLSVVFDAPHAAGAIEVAWLLRAQGDAILRFIRVSEDRMAHELWVEPQDLHAVRFELCDNFCFGAE